MAMVTYPLNNVEYSAEDAELYNAVRMSGVWSGKSFEFSANGEDANITVGEGLAWIANTDFSGKVVAQKQAEVFDFGISDPSYPRIDVLAIQFNSIENQTSLVIKKGTPASNPEIPERSTTEGKYELYLFSVYRKNGTSVISNNDITDLRDDRNYCGYMQDAVKPGYAPSLMEHNNGNDFRFWVGTREEYDAQKDDLKENTFCVITDDDSAEVINGLRKDVSDLYKRITDETDDKLETLDNDLSGRINILNTKVSSAQDDINDLYSSKAPSGFGLGSAVKKSWSSVDSIYQPGWYKFTDANMSISGGNYSGIYIHVSSMNEKYVVQTAYPVTPQRRVLKRYMYNGSWGVWLDVDPAMNVGSTYATTKKHNGKIVYATRIIYKVTDFITSEVVAENVDELVSAKLNYVEGAGKTYNIITPNSEETASLILDNNNLLFFANTGKATSLTYSVDIEYTKK